MCVEATEDNRQGKIDFNLDKFGRLGYGHATISPMKTLK